MSVAFDRRLQEVWYGGRKPSMWMTGLSFLYRLLLALKDLLYRSGLRRVQRFEVPILVVGNITVGGTGKTPLVIRLVDILRSAGYQTGVVSRGYGSSAGGGPRLVEAASEPAAVGDESLLIHQRTGAPVMVGSNRIAGIRALLADHSVDIIISDDGLQYRKMGRDIEIAVIDGDRRLGNGRLLPAGPLRELVSRLESVDFTLVNSGKSSELAMHLNGDTLEKLQDGSHCSIADFEGQVVAAVAGIGNPERFFRQLETAGMIVDRQPYPDHHSFTQSDLSEFDARLVIMTEKDAVKCRAFAGPNWWALPVDAHLPPLFEQDLLSRLEQIRR